MLLHSNALAAMFVKTRVAWYVYVIQSTVILPGRHAGDTYVGATTDPVRRLQQHYGVLKGGARCTSKSRPWVPRSLHGPYADRKSALRAEYALKHGKRGEGRCRWSVGDSELCCGAGPNHPWVLNPTAKIEEGVLV